MKFRKEHMSKIQWRAVSFALGMSVASLIAIAIHMSPEPGILMCAIALTVAFFAPDKESE